NANNYSVALMLEYGDTRFLFTGDAEEESEAEMQENGFPLEADVYKVAHHGSSSASTEGFLEVVNPSYAVISCGEDNSYGHPHAEVLNRLRQRGIEVFRTDQQGSITAISDGENIIWNCDSDTSWKAGEPLESDREEETDGAVTTEETYYILNTNTKKIHLPSCKSVVQIKEKNCEESAKSRSELINMGYEPCKNCNP
ncbi:MAG: ComEC/Rec2 family competence protein, partial [Lachnospiraceae bacterium]